MWGKPDPATKHTTPTLPVDIFLDFLDDDTPAVLPGHCKKHGFMPLRRDELMKEVGRARDRRLELDDGEPYCVEVSTVLEFGLQSENWVFNEKA
jgi:hypothetical protein